MKNVILFCALCAYVGNSFAQKATFDITTFTPPTGWKKQTAESAIQFSKEDAAKGTYCLMTLYKAVPGTNNSKENFDLAWTSIVKEMVTVSTAPEMQAVTTENGWETQSGFAPFESDGNKGIALLVTASAVDKMVNLIILTNTDLYEKEMTSFIESISLKKLNTVANKPVTNIVNPAQTNTITKKDGFAFTTTNFDDGWTSTVQNDWVEVTKDNTSVLIHYPNKQADAYNSVVMDGLKNAWNILVAPRYSSASNFEFKPVTGWQAIEFAEADMVEKSTGKTVHVVLFKMNYSNGSGRYLEFITSTKNSFEQEFGAYHQTTSGWENMEKMANYNKFAVTASDLKGKWTSDFSGAIQYVNATTGFDSHMDTHASAENFTIGNNNIYNWDISLASGAVGNIKFQSKKSSGKFSMSGNWKVNFSDIEGKPRNYDTYFSCIKGLRILWLDGRPFAKVQ
jgi:hypothetical protein